LVFEVNLSEVDDQKYMAGEMMYLEYRIYNNNKNHNTVRNVLGRELIQINGLKSFRESLSFRVEWLILVGVVGLLLAIIVVYFFHVRNKRQVRKLKYK